MESLKNGSAPDQMSAESGQTVPFSSTEAAGVASSTPQRKPSISKVESAKNCGEYGIPERLTDQERRRIRYLELKTEWRGQHIKELEAERDRRLEALVEYNPFMS